MLTIETVSQEAFASRFVTGPVVSSNQYPVWLRFTLQQPVKPGTYCVNLFTPADKTVFYWKGSILITGHNGPTVPYARRSFFHPNYVSVTLDESSTVFFVRLNPVMVSYTLPQLVIEPREPVLKKYERGLVISYGVTGAVLVFVLCSLALFLFLRNISFLAYALFLVCFYAMTNKQFLQYLLGDALPLLLLDSQINQLFFIANAVSFLTFAAAYFNIMVVTRVWKYVFMGLMLGSVVCTAIVFLSDISTSSLIILLYNLAAVGLVTSYAVYHFVKRRTRGAFYFVFGMGFVVAIAALIGLNSFGVIAIPRLDLLANFSVLIFSVILLIGIIQRYRETLQQKISKEHEARLLKIRTSELSDYNDMIREQKSKMEKQAFALEELNATKDKLLSVLSHDLRGPVGNLNMILELLGNKNLTADEFYQLSGKLKTDVASTYAMLEEVLQWVKSQRDGIMPNPSGFDVNELLRETALYYRSVAEAKQIVIHTPKEAGPKAFADRDHISIVLRNVLGNAVKFSPEGSDIDIAVETIGRTIKIAVKDSGLGMSVDDIQRILRKERIQGMVGTKGEKGTGLGLFLCMEFLEYNKGSFNLESGADKGITASFTIPAAKQQ